MKTYRVSGATVISGWQQEMESQTRKAQNIDNLRRNLMSDFKKIPGRTVLEVSSGPMFIGLMEIVSHQGKDPYCTWVSNEMNRYMVNTNGTLGRIVAGRR